MSGAYQKGWHLREARGIELIVLWGVGPTRVVRSFHEPVTDDGHNKLPTGTHTHTEGERDIGHEYNSVAIPPSKSNLSANLIPMLNSGSDSSNVISCNQFPRPLHCSVLT